MSDFLEGQKEMLQFLTSWS